MTISSRGLMADKIRAYPWQETPLGSIATWSPELACSVDLVLAMPHPATLYWGEHLIMLYNDGYAEILADKHPASLGQPAATVFHEAWSFVASEIEAAWTGRTILREHVLIPIMRYGRMTDLYWSYSFMPVYEAGQIRGILNGSVHTAESLVKLSNKVVQTESLADRVLQSIADAVIVTDAQNRITRMNAVAEALTGWTLSEARGLFLADVFRIVHETTRNTVQDPGRTVTRTGESISLAEHTVLLTRGGREISVGDSAAPIHDAQANTVGTVLVFRDISERRAAERERDEILTRLTEIMAASQDGISIIGRDWRILYQNAQADRVTAPEGDVIGRSLWELFPEGLYEGSPAEVNYRRAMEARLPASFEHFYEPYGITFATSVFPSTEGVICFFRDVSEQRRGEKEREHLAEQLHEVLEATTDGVFILDRQWNFTFVNSTARILLAASGELIGRNYWEAYPQNDNPDSIFYKNYHRAMDEGAPSDFEGYYPEPYESWFRAIVRPTPSGITVFFRDVTASRKATEALIQSEKLAVMGTLAASIAHEVNNPLEAVTNLIYLAKNSESFDVAREYLETADQELGRAAAITNHTLRFHKQSTNPIEVDSASLIEGVLAIHKGRISNAHVTVERRLRAKRPIFCFDGEIRQVLSNLIGNAADAMQPQGNGRLIVRSRDGHNWTTGQAGLLVTIADTGPGMNSVTAKKAFDAFYSTKGMAGTGLGLWVSKEIVLRHRGKLRFCSRQTAKLSGTVFSLFLPYDAALRD